MYGMMENRQVTSNKGRKGTGKVTVLIKGGVSSSFIAAEKAA
jgi:hypothetical protein